MYINIVYASAGPCICLAEESRASGKAAQAFFALSTLAVSENGWPSVLPAMWISAKSINIIRATDSCGIGGFMSASFVRVESIAASTAGTIFH